MAEMETPNYDGQPDKVLNGGLTPDELSQLVKNGYITDPQLIAKALSQAPSPDQTPTNSSTPAAPPTPEATPSSEPSPDMSTTNSTDMAQGNAPSTDTTYGAGPQGNVPISSPAPSGVAGLYQKQQDELKGSRAAFDSASKDFNTDAKASADYNKVAAPLIQGAYNQQANVFSQNAAQMQKQMEHQNAMFAAAQAKTEKDSAALEDFAKNKGSYWDSKSTGQKILAAISLGLGGFVQGYTHGQAPNGAAEIINKEIEQWAQEQKFKYEGMRDKVSADNTLYGKALELAGNQNSALGLIQQYGLGAAQATVNSVMAGTAKDKEGLALKTDLDMKKAELAKAIPLMASQTQITQTDMQNSGQNMKDIPEQYLSPEQRAQYVPGYGFASGTEAKKKVDAARDATMNLAGLSDSILNAMDSTNLSDSSQLTAKSGELKAELVELRTALRKDIFGKNVNRNEIITVDDAIDDPTSLKNIVNQNALRSSIRTLAGITLDKFDRTLKENGVDGRGDDFTQYREKFPSVMNSHGQSGSGLQLSPGVKPKTVTSMDASSSPPPPDYSSQLQSKINQDLARLLLKKSNG